MKTKISIILFFVLATTLKPQSIYEPVDLNKIESSLEEMGKMWTFDAIPLDYFESEYGFKPTKEWIEDVMKSALQFGNGCSGAFVSSEGLIMTNHHCAREYLTGLSPEGKDYLRDGYYAENLQDELKMEGLFVDQLIAIYNVTEEIIDAMKEGKNDSLKIELKKNKIAELEKQYSDKTGLICKVVELYHGGKYSLYAYKRYKDIRLVMSPDFQIASTGWDWDNFTYPRYELDFMFLRAYENNKPVKTDNFFRFSKKGAEENEPVFIIGRPGSTRRLLPVSRLRFLRDKVYPYYLLMFNEVYKVYYELFETRKEERSYLLNAVMSWGNARKSYAGRLMALKDPLIMKKKEDFEKKFRNTVLNNPALNKNFGHLWEAIEKLTNEQAKYADELAAFTIYSFLKPVYFDIAEKVIFYTEQMRLPEKERLPEYRKDKLKQTIENIFPQNIDTIFQKKLVRAHINYVVGILGDDHQLTQKIYQGKSGDEALEIVMSSTYFKNKSTFEKLVSLTPDAILSSNDPFISFLIDTREKLNSLRKKVNEIDNSLEILLGQLGRVAYEIYGDRIPPDATLTIRITDGRIKGYEYNGTIAPPKTTFYGIYDRWNSFGRKDYPWGLHERWRTIPDSLNLAVPVGFASTNDIVGGNSGSSVININKEVVGLVHDGNLESLAGDFIFLETNNRAVATDALGLMESLKYVFKTKRLINELETGKAK
ncbi:S46 family peptidase [Melioribacter sp. OK-6-Me]|uniref:S46 family peptidase n=1 Tax=unclassified Melioribacter TaxID=2627329 RepID=UPI003ED9062B